MDIGNGATVVCFVCKIQNANYRCPRCSSRYCSAACYQRHGANCTETFYREHVTDMLKSSHSDSDSKRKMVEILRRCNLADDDDGGGDVTGAKNAEFLGSVLESVDLRDAEYEELGEEQQAAFRQAVSQGRLDHLIDVWSPWWISAPLTGLCSQPSPAHAHPIPAMTSLCNVPPSPSVGYVLVACSCCYAVLMRVWNGEPDAPMAHALLRSCKFLSKQEAASVQMHSVDSVLNDCFSCLCDAAVGLPRAAIPAAVADLLCILATRHFVLSALSVALPPPPPHQNLSHCCVCPDFPAFASLYLYRMSIACCSRTPRSRVLRTPSGKLYFCCLSRLPSRLNRFKCWRALFAATEKRF